MLNDSVDHPGLPSRLRETISVNGGDATASDLERGAHGFEAQSQVLFPELAAPSVVVSPHHYDREATAKPGQSRGNMEPPPGYHPGIGEPEVEQVTVDEKAIAQLRHSVEELEECLFDRGRRHT
jgi:hypothetical protein